MSCQLEKVTFMIGLLLCISISSSMESNIESSKISPEVISIQQDLEYMIDAQNMAIQSYGVSYTPAEYINSTIERKKTTTYKLIGKSKMIELLNVPDVFQATYFNCGPASLVALMGFYSIFDYRQMEIAQYAGSNPEHGTSPRKLFSFGLSKGLRIELMENMTLNNLLTYIGNNVPVMVILQAWREGSEPPYDNDFDDGHYAVAIGYDAENLYFEDPWIIGRIAILSRQEFLKRWHGSVNDERFYNLGIILREPRNDIENLIYLE